MSPAIPILGMDALLLHRCVLACSRVFPTLELGELHPPSTPSLTKGLHVGCTINGQPMTALLDTGATCCFMSRSQADQLGMEVRRVESGGAASITGKIPIVGQTSEVHVTFLGHSATTSFCVQGVGNSLVIGLKLLLDARMELTFEDTRH
ncbi:hypothetical protein E2C01_071627 [Portunus trituberculatus]|uniref:Peptidase A2 domain-containing protein n=1 Tax=Portunus trituberculatus TaxID=210409 RepID=A0A5B7HVU5_PORTR|nr:hypothetical protein [Portunus trituberculatus]